MKIGLLINKIDTEGGIQKNYKLLYELFKSKGIDTYIFVLHPPKLIQIKDKNIIFVKGFTTFDKGIYLHYLLKKMEPFNLFLVNAEYMKRYLPFSNYYITAHNTWTIKKKGLKGWRRKQKIVSKYKNQNVIGISNSVVDNITNVLQIPVKSKTTIYAPHDFAEVKRLARENVIIPDEYIVGVGGLNIRKRFDLLIQAFSTVSKYYPNLHLVIVGIGKEMNKLQNLANSLNLNEKIHFMGFQENPYPYIKNAKLLVSSSSSEGLSRVIVEALSLNTPVVATLSSNGIHEIMQNELSKYVVPIDNLKALEQMILNAFEHYPEIHKSYYEKFDINRIFQQYMQLIDYPISS